MDLEEIGINADNWVVSAQDRNYCWPKVRVNSPNMSVFLHVVHRNLQKKKKHDAKISGVMES